LLRAVGFLVRDENCWHLHAAISNLNIDQRADSFSVSFHAVCRRPDQEIAYDARIEGTRGGNLVFDGTAIPKNRLQDGAHRVRSAASAQGRRRYPVEVEHVDGRIVKDKFPELVNPIQPSSTSVRLTHEVMRD